jgi:hypothetical protein
MIYHRKFKNKNNTTGFNSGVATRRPSGAPEQLHFFVVSLLLNVWFFKLPVINHLREDEIVTTTN